MGLGRWIGKKLGLSREVTLEEKRELLETKSINKFRILYSNVPAREYQQLEKLGLMLNRDLFDRYDWIDVRNESVVKVGKVKVYLKDVVQEIDRLLEEVYHLKFHKPLQ